MTFTHLGRTWTLYQRLRAGVATGDWYFKIDNQPRSLQTTDAKLAIRHAKARLDARAAAPDKYRQFLDATAARATLTVGQLAGEWRTAGCPLPNGTRRTARQAADQEAGLRLALRWWANRHPASVTQPVMGEYADWRRGQTTRANCTGDRSIDLELTVLANLCAWALARGRLEANPFATRLRYQNSKAVQHCHTYMPASDEELHRLVGFLFTSDDQRHVVAGAQYLFCALTGQRPGEPGILRRDAAYMDGQPSPGVRFTRTLDGVTLPMLGVAREKGGQNPAVKVHPALAAFLAAWLPWRDTHYGASSWWFPDPRDPERPLADTRDTKRLSLALNWAAAALGLPERHPHGARAFYVRVRRSQEVDDTTIGAELGHNSGPAIVGRVYGKPDAIIGDGRFDWLPAGPDVRIAWERLGQSR